MGTAETPGGRIPRWLTSQDGVLGLLVSNDLLFRTLADVPWRRVPALLDILSDSVVTSVTLSLLAEYSTTFGPLADAAQWLLLSYLFAILTPYLFLRSARPITTELSFRIIVSITALGSAFVMTDFLVGGGRADSAGFVLRFLGVSLTGAVLFGIHFASQEQWNSLEPTTRVTLLNRFVPLPAGVSQELLSGFTAGGRRAWLERLTWKAALITICLIPVFLLSLVAVLGSLLFPLLELTVLGGLVVRRWGGSIPWLDTTFDIDLETRLFESARHASRGLKGMTLTVLIFVGLLFPVGVIAATLAFIFQRLGDAQQLIWMVSGVASMRATVVGVWNHLGVVTTLLGSASLQLWFWLRMLDRLPFYLDTWEARRPSPPGYRTAARTRVDSQDLFEPHFLLTPPPFYQRILARIHEATNRVDPPPTRPVGAIALSMLAVGASIVFVGTELDLVAGIGYAVVWPIAVTLLAVSVVVTARADPQPIRTDTKVLPGALCVQLGGYLVLLRLVTHTTSITAESSLQSLGIQSGAVFVLIIVPWFHLIADVVRFGRQQTGRLQYVPAGYIILFGIAGLLVAQGLGAGLVASLVRVVSGLSLLGGFLVALGIRSDRAIR